MATFPTTSSHLPRRGPEGLLYVYEVEKVSTMISCLLTQGIAALPEDVQLSAVDIADLCRLRDHDHSDETIRRNVRLIAESISRKDAHISAEVNWPRIVAYRVAMLLRRAEGNKRQTICIRIDRTLLDRLNDEATAAIALAAEHYLANGSWPKAE